MFVRTFLILCMMIYLSACSAMSGIKPQVEEYAVAHTMAACGMGMTKINGKVYTRIEDEVLTNERISVAKRLQSYQDYTRCIRKMPKHPTSNYQVLHVMSVCGLGVENAGGGIATRLVEHVFKTNSFSTEDKAKAYHYYTDCVETLSKWIQPKAST